MSAISYSVGLSTSAFTGGISLMRNSIGGLTGAMAGIGKNLATGGLIAGIGGITTAFIGLKKASDLAAEMESTATAFRVLMGDAEAAKKMLQSIEALAASTPFEFPELAGAGRNLLAFGIEANRIIPLLTSIGDVASGIQAPIGELADIFGQAKTSGQLFTEDLNQLGGRGIPIIKVLADMLGRGEGEIRKIAEAGQLTFPFLEQAFINLTAAGGKFHGMMAEQATTMKGRISSLTDAWNSLLRQIGTPLNDWLKPQIVGWTANIEAAGVRFGAFLKLVSAAQKNGNLMEFLGTGLNIAFKEAINIFSGGIRGGIAFLSETLPAVFRAGAAAFTDSGLITIMQLAFRGIADTFAARILRAAAALDPTGTAANAADASQATADSALSNLPRLIAGIRLDKGLEKAAPIITEAFSKGAAAFSKANAATLIDVSGDHARLAQLSQQLDPQAYEKFVSGQKDAAVAVENVTKKAAGFDAALAGLTTTAKKEKAKSHSGADTDYTPDDASPEHQGPRRRIYMRKAKDLQSMYDAVKTNPSAYTDSETLGYNKFGRNSLETLAKSIGYDERTKQINNAGRNAFGKNHAPRPERDRREPTLSPIEKTVSLLESVDRRLAALGLA